MNVTKEQILNCQKTVTPHIHRTPVLTSHLLNEISGANLFFKCENFQRMGAFKMRGATYAISQLTDKQKEKGVVTHSSGNFAQALSLSALSLGVKAYIVMPENAPQVKKNAVMTYNGEITECASNLEAREKTAKHIVKSKGATFIHPSNNLDVILGNSTAALELFEDYPQLHSIVAPIGGGGLIAGTALASKLVSANCQVFGAEPFEVDDAYRSFKSGAIESNITTNTIADGLRTTLGDINFPIIQEHASDIIRVEEQEILSALRLIWERLKIVVEPSSAVAFASVLKDKKRFKGKDVGIILSGGNVDLDALKF